MASGQHPLGRLVRSNGYTIVVVVTLALLALCAALKSASLDGELSSWLQRSARVEAELSAVQAAIGEGSGTSNLLVLQAPRGHRQNALTVETLMVHLETLAIATHVTVDLYDVSWSLKDLCFSPTPPDYEGLHVGLMLDSLMPCAIKTPLDCFWEGAKLHGPEQPVSLGALGPKLKWTSLNPALMVEARQRAQPHASFPYEALLDWMRRVGISSGYQLKPCLDPTDPNCPDSAPNKLQGSADIGAELTGGCRGLAEHQMHWREEELVGGVTRNQSGKLVHARALQSIIQMMGAQDVFDYWRRTSKVQDVNNWSTDKAKVVLSTWQRRFKEELEQFARTSAAAAPFQLHAMTPDSLEGPVDIKSLLDLSNFGLAFALMTLCMCVVYPNFSLTSGSSIGRHKTVLLALLTAHYVGITFLASLGLSSFMSLPFNMATTQILPPLALYFGFKQVLTVANSYAQNFAKVPFKELNSHCLNNLILTIVIESISYIIPLLVASCIPMQATRMFALQAVTYILLSLVTGLLLIPALHSSFLLHHAPLTYTQDGKSVYSVHAFVSAKAKRQHQPDESIIEQQIFSRLPDDLKNIKADSPQPQDINFTHSIQSQAMSACLRVSTSSMGQIRNNMSDACKPDADTKISMLPDILACAMPQESSGAQVPQAMDKCSVDTKVPHSTDESLATDSSDQPRNSLLESYIHWLARNKFAQVFICLIKVSILIAIFSQAKSVRYGLHLKDIVHQGTAEYESLSLQENYFPVYNVFAVTKSTFDYAANQRLLHEFYKKLAQVDGIVRDDQTDKPKFWLTYFRSWLLELQQRFDADRNKSLISREGWAPEASDASKLAYKLLAQTGRVDNPIEKSQVETNRLVDSNGIINPKAFYYYLTAWVMNDAFTYSNSEANLRPEPKVWKDNPDDLRIERARPITYAQIPFLMKLPSIDDSLNTIKQMRIISQAFEQLNLPNFPTGVPFVFWDQFINLDLLYLCTMTVSITVLYLVISSLMSSFKSSAIILVPIILTQLQLYGLLGLLSIPFNNVIAVLLLATIGISSIQVVQQTTYFLSAAHCENSTHRLVESVKFSLKTLIFGLILLSIGAIVFRCARVDFLSRYSLILASLVVLNLLNSILITPVLLCNLKPEIKKVGSSKGEINSVRKKTEVNWEKKIKRRVRKKRTYPRIKSENSLSTISEEPHLEAHVSDLKLELSIRCY